MLIECSTPETLGMLILSEEHMFLFAYINIYIHISLLLPHFGLPGEGLMDQT